jgi:hypothetical protein
MKLLRITALLMVAAVSAFADYAIFYNHQDLTAIAANVNATLSGNYDQYLTTGERTLAKQTFQKHWNGGLKNWSTAPVAPVEYQGGDADTRIIVVGGQGVIKQDLITVLYLISQRVPGTAYMGSIARDLEATAVEPWPQ